MNIFPSPGWHIGVPENEYHASRLCSASTLKLLEKSPAHVLYERERAEPEEREALIIGAATHRAVLEPERFAKLYAVAPDVDRRTKDGKAAYAAFVAENADAIILTASQMASVRGMADAVREHPAASDLLAAATEIEVSGVWEDRESGVMCKMRADLCCAEFGGIVDLKTCQDASPAGFWRDVANNRYYRQGAMYLSGAQALGRHYTGFAVIAVEKAPPHHVACYQLTDEYLEIGKRELRPLLEQYRDCEESGNWPGYPDYFVELAPPKWLKDRANNTNKQESYESNQW